MNELQRTVWVVAWMTVILYAAVAVLAIFSHLDADRKQAQLRRLTLNTNQSLCALRGDLEKRVAESRRFLRDHPHAIPGISPAQIRQSISNQQQTVNALGRLEC